MDYEAIAREIHEANRYQDTFPLDEVIDILRAHFPEPLWCPTCGRPSIDGKDRATCAVYWLKAHPEPAPAERGEEPDVSAWLGAAIDTVGLNNALAIRRLAITRAAHPQPKEPQADNFSQKALLEWRERAEKAETLLNQQAEASGEDLTAGQDIAAGHFGSEIDADHMAVLAKEIDEAIKANTAEIIADRDYHAARARSYEAEADNAKREIDRLATRPAAKDDAALRT